MKGKFMEKIRLYTVLDVCNMLNMRVSTVRQYTRQGLIKSFKIGKHIRYKENDIKEIINGSLTIGKANI